MADSTWVDATVTGTAPLRVRLDGDASALPFAPDSLVKTSFLAVDDRVRCELAQGRVVIHGRATGLNIPADTQAQLDAVKVAARNRNRIVNGNFRTNQRGYAGGAPLPHGSYCHDRWRLGPAAAPISLNGDFESNTTGWTGTSSTLASDSGWALVGTKSLKQTPSASASFAASGNLIGAGVTANTVITVTAASYIASAVAAVGAFIEVYHRVGAGNYQVLASDPAEPVAGISLHSLTVAVPAGTTELYIRLWNSASTTVQYWDDVKVGVAGSYTSSTTPQQTTITLATGTILQQIIERAEIPAGNYVLSWSGTATARIYKVGATPGAFSAGPITYTADGLERLVIEFVASGGTKTLTAVQLEAGSMPTPFEVIPLQQELALCQRFFYTRDIGDVNLYNQYWAVALSGGGQQVMNANHPVPMRRAPRPHNGTAQLATFDPQLHSFTYFNYSAGSQGTRSVNLGATKNILTAGYSSSYTGNGGGSLAVGFTSASNLGAIYVSGEML